MALPTQHVEKAADHDSSIRLQGESGHDIVGARIKAIVQTAVGVQAREPQARLPVDLKEHSTQDNLPIRLHSQAMDGPEHVGHEIGVLTAIGVEPGQEVSPQISKRRERAADQELAVGLHDQGVHRRAGKDIQPAVHGAIRFEEGEIIAELPADLTEIASDENRPVRLRGECAHGAACVGVEAVVGALRENAAQPEQGQQAARVLCDQWASERAFMSGW